MKKTGIVIALISCTLLSGCSSGVPQNQYESVVAERDEYKAALEKVTSISEESNDKKTEELNKKEEPQKIVLIDSGWCSYKNGDYAHVPYAVKIENPNKDFAIGFPKIIITAKNADGKILKNDERTLNVIAGGDSIFYGDEIFYEGEEPVIVEISVSNSKDDYVIQDNQKYAKQSDFIITNISENNGTYKTFTGEITNDSNIDLDSAAVIIIYKAEDRIVGGDIEYVDDLEAGLAKAFELSADSDMTQYDSYEFYAIQY